MIELAKHRECTGCMACTDSCAKGAIVADYERDGHLYPRIKHDLCIQCGMCQKVCPVINGYIYEQDVEYKPLLAWSNDDVLRLKSASGGIFAGVATHVLEDGGLVVGCTMEGFQANHVIIDNAKDLSKLQGSKYLHSNLTGIYRQLKKELSDTSRVVLFSGTRCQVAGLLSYLGKIPDNLITIDIVCAGVPSYHLVKYFKGNYMSIDSFRNKDNGWKHGCYLTLVGNDGKLLPNEMDAEIQANGYLVGLTNRYSCYDCKFAKLHSKADVTIMDYWGENEHPEEHFKGVSCVIPNTKKGLDTLKNSNLTLLESDWTKCIPYNPRVVYGKSKGYEKNIIRALMPFAFTHFSKSVIKILYVRNLTWANPIHWPFKLYRYFSWYKKKKAENKFINDYIKKLDADSITHIL